MRFVITALLLTACVTENTAPTLPRCEAICQRDSWPAWSCGFGRDGAGEASCSCAVPGDLTPIICGQ